MPVAEVLKAPCPRPARPDRPSVGDLAGFSVQQEAALSVCEARKDAAVQIIEIYNQVAKATAAGSVKTRRWRLWP